MKKFVIGDIHGSFKALMQCLEKSNFNYDEDQLIVLGDVVDGWSETPFAVEELLKIKNLVLILGNHDVWARDWFQFGARPIIWTQQGGQATIDSYIANPDLMIKHRDFFNKSVNYYVDDEMRLFVHGGFNPEMKIEEQHVDFLTWDRDLYNNRNNDFSIDPYKEVFIGHTTTWRVSHKPFMRNNVWFLDQGCGWEGCLSIMDVDTHEFWQSDRSEELYPGVHGR